MIKINNLNESKLLLVKVMDKLRQSYECRQNLKVANFDPNPAIHKKSFIKIADLTFAFVR
jgi:hypothetical protein